MSAIRATAGRPTPDVSSEKPTGDRARAAPRLNSIDREKERVIGMLSTEDRQRISDSTEQLIRAMARTDPGTVRPETRLVEELGFDSLRLIELAVAIEQRLGLRPFDLEQAITTVTVGDAVDLALHASQEDGPAGR
jgi:acyl carrier protein